MGRIHGRITNDDIRAAGLRRWDGRRRITTDWIKLFREDELCFPNGDCLVYLREPGQSSRGPSFRIHTALLVNKGFQGLVQRTTVRPVLHAPATCRVPSCDGCDIAIQRELFLPAPRTDLDTRIDHHLVTRNFFAWLYNIPLVGRALGQACIDVKARLDEYRPGEEMRNQLQLVSFLEYHKYLDFRECIEHALAALHFAETLELEDLWIDAFAHCVGLSHQDMFSSLEYPFISKVSRNLIQKARLEMDLRLDRVSRCVMNFFENDLSSSKLGLPQAARDHFDRFRSFLHAFYIEQHGFWPPDSFQDDAAQKALYSQMYSDFRNLYHHLVDPESSPSMDAHISVPGGVCTLQNIKSFDDRHSYEALPHPLPLLPDLSALEPSAASTPSTPSIPSKRSSGSSNSARRSSLNPLRKRQALKEMRIELGMQALVDSSNRDWSITSCLLVRRYQDFEQRSVFDDFERVSVVDGRKVRWILVYAVLQTLISVMQAPQPVRNTQGLSYWLCCHAPKVMPWRLGLSERPEAAAPGSISDGHIELGPDLNYSHTTSSASSLSKERKASLKKEPSNERKNSLSKSELDGTPTRSISKRASLRRLLSRRGINTAKSTPPTPKIPQFCEIFVQGYGNGLHNVTVESFSSSTSSTSEKTKRPGSDVLDDASSNLTERPADPATEPSSVSGVSRESSSASNNSSRSTGTNGSGTNTTTDSMPDMDHLSVHSDDSVFRRDSGADKGKGKAVAVNQDVGIIHFNTATWDKMLEA